MPFSEQYRAQAALLLRVLPFVAEEKDFALKGVTAINLFVRDMPRLSVDIDLTYLQTKSYEDSLVDIDAALRRISTRIRARLQGVTITESKTGNLVRKLFVHDRGVQIKTEVTPVIRGCVYEPQVRSVSETVEDTFGFAEIKVVSFADLYAEKMVAALDRQHPRDFFDIRDLLAEEGIDDELRRAFIDYMLSHDRPMSEVLAPRRKDILEEYARGFQGMTEEDVPLKELTDAREALIADIVGKMPADHRRFLISFEKGEPDWDLLGLPKVADLPAVKWRQFNLDKLTKEKRAALVAGLEKVLVE